MLQSVLGVLLGLLLGLVINYVADVLPTTNRLSRPVCGECKHSMGWGNFLLIKKCPNCGQYRSFRFWAVVLSMIGFSILLWFFPFNRINYWISILLLAYFEILFVIDIEHRLIFIFTCIVGLIGAIPLGIWLRYTNPKLPANLLYSFEMTIIGGVAGFLIMLGVYYLGILFNRIMSRIRKHPIQEEAFGYGDVLVSGIIGFLLGWPGVLLALLITILSGGIFSGIYLLIMTLKKKYQAFTAIPYAPFLILSTLILLYFIK